jgi:hypothetical protein
MDFQKAIDTLKEIDESLTDEINRSDFHQASSLSYISDYIRMITERLVEYVEYNKVNIE